MSELQPLLWATKTAHDKSQRATCERLQNCFLEKNPDGAITPWKILGTPGKKFKVALGAGPYRGSTILNGTLFVVSGTSLYSVDSNWLGTSIGAVPGVGPCPMCANDSAGGGVGQLFMATNAGSYFYSAGTGLIVQVDANVYSSVTAQDGYAIAALANSQMFYVTNVDDFSTIGALSYSSADAYNGAVMAGFSCNRIVTFFGRDFLSAYANSGNANKPFALINGSTLEIGCGASLSPAADLSSGTVDFLASDWSVQTYQPGGGARPISTPGIESWIRRRVQPQLGQGIRHRSEGHDFYVLTWRDGTIAYDHASGLWHDRVSWAAPNWSASGHIRVYGDDVVGDDTNGNLYALDPDTFTDATAIDASTPIVREIQPPPVHGNGNRVIMDEVRLEAEMGVGLDGSVSGCDPQVSLSWSDDAGKTFGNQLVRSLGKGGDYGLLASWNRLGQFKRRTLKFSISDPIKIALMGAYWRGDLCNG